MSGNDAVAAIRQQIERKYSEALQALETLKAYFADTQPAALQPAGDQALTPPVPQAPEAELTTVDRVLQAIANEYKTVEQLATELSISGDSIRGALYSKFVQSRIVKKKIHNKMAFRGRVVADATARQPTVEITVADLVRDHLTKHPEGQTSGQIHAAVTDAVHRIGGSPPAIGAALYNMKKSGRAVHDVTTGIYRLAKNRPAVAVHRPQGAASA